LDFFISEPLKEREGNAQNALMGGQTMKQNEFPPGWDKKRIQNVTSYDEQQTDAEAEAASQNEFSMLMEVLTELGPAVCEWILESLVDSQ
jgi:hypothetical protein